MEEPELDFSSSPSALLELSDRQDLEMYSPAVVVVARNLVWQHFSLA